MSETCKSSMMCCRYNNLLGAIHDSLKALLKALKGLVVMSQALEEMANSLYINHVPDLWAAKVGEVRWTWFSLTDSHCFRNYFNTDYIIYSYMYFY